MTRGAHPLWGVLCWLWLSPLAGAQNGFAGSEACKMCHDDVWSGFNRNPHFKSVALGREKPEHAGCEGCHGPGQAHIDAGGGRETIPRAFSLLTPKKVIDTCLACHGADFERANIRRSEHTLANIACNRCHSIHHPATQKYLLARRQTELCYGCHESVRADFAMPVKHRVEEGVIQCSDCHNPHGSFAATWRMASRPRLARQALNEESCLKCHMDKRGPFVFEHTPMRVDGCETCHAGHGSANAKLLRRPAVFTLCLECHNGSGNFGARGRGITLEDSSHNMLDPRYQKCTSCHVRIHGSNSDQTFFR